jgi:hypothetical protein
MTPLPADLSIRKEGVMRMTVVVQPYNAEHLPEGETW